MIRSFDELFSEVRNRPRKTLVVPAAAGVSILKACDMARRQGICDSILVGDGGRIRELMAEHGIAADDFRIENESDPEQAVVRSLELIRNGRGSMLMKGKTDTPTLLKAVLDGDIGLRTGRVLSHVAVVEMPTYDRLMLMTDGGLNIRPDLEKRQDIIRNAVEFAHMLGNDCPNVALLSATEKVNPKMEETLDYEKIVTRQQDDPFVEALIEGPVAMDIALDAEAARIKGVTSRITGQTDIFVVPEISTCNIMVMSLLYLAGAKVSGLVVGARVPVVLLSRADDSDTKLRSIALGAIWS